LDHYALAVGLAVWTTKTAKTNPPRGCRKLLINYSRLHGGVEGCYVFAPWFIYLFLFCQPNLSRLATDLAEIWRADRKLV